MASATQRYPAEIQARKRIKNTWPKYSATSKSKKREIMSSKDCVGGDEEAPEEKKKRRGDEETAQNAECGDKCTLPCLLTNGQIQD